MKRLIILMSWVLTIPALLASCDNGDNYYFVGETADAKASKMESVSSLLESIARQPEMAEDLITAAEQTLYLNYRELLPLSDKAAQQRGTARGKAIGSLFESIARQPEIYDLLDETAEQFLGPYNRAYISPELNDYAKTAASAKIIESIARQPEMAEQFNTLSIKYLNTELQQNTVQ